MRDDQVRRYARHILLPDVGGLGQTSLLVATARIVLRESAPDAELIAATYLAAGGVGTLILEGATEDQLAALTKHAPDTQIATDAAPAERADEVLLAPRPPWWPVGADDAGSLAFWRGGLAATRWMATIANK